MAASRMVLLRSSWATVNIGDVAHSPGVIQAINEYWPGGVDEPPVEVVLWPVRLNQRERQMLAKSHPKTQVVDGSIINGRPDTAELARVLERADVLVHGSGAGIFVHDDLRWWRRHRQAPYGFFGVTVDPLCPPTTGSLDQLSVMVDHLAPGFLGPELQDLLDNAAFVYCRDSFTLRLLQGQQVQAPVLGFGPDGTFACGVASDAQADEFLRALQLERNRFACFVPRLRYAPYAQIYGVPPSIEQQRRNAVNAATACDDLAVLAAGIDEWVTSTGLPAVVVPEMSYAVETAQELLPSLLTPQAAESVTILDRYWPLDEAVAVYRASSAVISMECHSPIMASVVGTPTLYLRQPTETFKSAMYADLGQPTMVIEIADPCATQLTRTAVADLAGDPAAAAARSSALNAAARDHLSTMVASIAQLTAATNTAVNHTAVEHIRRIEALHG